MEEVGGPPRPGPGFPHAVEDHLGELAQIPDPAFLLYPGGRIGAVNRPAADLVDFSLVGMTVNALLDRYGAERPDGRRLIRGDLPHTRALRGETVSQGERIDATLPDGSVYRAVVTSTPIVVGGTVVASLSVFHDFETYVAGLAASAAPRP
jgi:PAS domain-containing protein